MARRCPRESLKRQAQPTRPPHQTGPRAPAPKHSNPSKSCGNLPARSFPLNAGARKSYARLRFRKIFSATYVYILDTVSRAACARRTGSVRADPALRQPRSRRSMQAQIYQARWRRQGARLERPWRQYTRVESAKDGDQLIVKVLTIEVSVQAKKTMATGPRAPPLCQRE